MKRWIAIFLVVLMLLPTLTACGSTLSGTYEAEAFGTTTAYTFKGSKVTIDVTFLGAVVASFEGTYEIDGSKITFTFGDDEEDAKQYSGAFTFEKNDENDTIKIGIAEYKKK